MIGEPSTHGGCVAITSDILERMWLPLEFANAVRRHWGSIVTSGAIIGALGIWQSTGHFVPHMVYWIVAAFGLVIAFYWAWRDEHLQALGATRKLNEEVAKLKNDSGQENKRELIWVLTVLRDLQNNVLFWREILKDKWGRAPETVNLMPEDWSIVIYQSEKISADTRNEVETVGSSLAQANSLITQFLSMQANFRDLQLLPPAYKLLDEAVPRLTAIIDAFEAFEKSLP